MKKIAIFGIVAIASGCMGGVGSACGGCISSKVQEEVEKKTGLGEAGDTEIDVENYKLTDQDVKKLIRDLPDVAGDMKDMGKIMDRTPTQPGKFFTGLAGSKALYAKLKAKGWNPPEKFFAVFAQSLIAMQYLQMGDINDAEMVKARKQMERALKNPNIPPEQKETIRQQLKSMDEVKNMLEGDEVLKHNVKVVKRHQEELAKVFGEVMGS